jgi:antitoxin ParD1/3/4
MNVSLTTELEKFVSAKVDSGRYNSASEVVREALRVLEEHDQARSVQLAGFNRELGRHLKTFDRGQHLSRWTPAPGSRVNPSSTGKPRRDALYPERGCRPRPGRHMGLYRRG